MKSSIPKILIGSSTDGCEYAVKLQEVIKDWADAYVWSSINMDGKSSALSYIEEQLDEIDICVFLMVDEDIIKMHDEPIVNCSDMLLNLFLSYAYIGRRNTFIAMKPNNNPHANLFIRRVSDLLRIVNPITYDFVKSIDGLANELKRKLFVQTNTRDKPEFFNSIKNKEKIKRVNITKDQSKPNAYHNDLPISAKIAFEEPPSKSEMLENTFKPKLEDDESVQAEIIKTYDFPAMNDEQYEFALVKKGEDVFITDQGKTLEYLDKIFELGEPDVVKNLVAILKQYGAIKIGHEFAIKIENWDGNTSEEDNDELKRKKYAFFSCISFMVNMKIFYV